MTPTERVRALTNEQLRVRVAELLGWRRDVVARAHGLPPAQQWYHPDLDGVRGLPDYPNDLNACHEMERTKLHTNPGLWLKYIDALMLRKDYAFGGAQAWVSASARQRCEAFVLTMEGV